jgi:acyl-coenzyme A thioesterase PaaI-like protein
MHARCVGLEAPFSSTLTLAPAGLGVFDVALSSEWAVGGGRLHGGWLLALVTKAGLAALRPAGADPLAVSAEFVRAPVEGPAEVRTEVVKTGRTVSVVRADLYQDGRLAVSATISAGRLPVGEREWAELPALDAAPPPHAPSTARGPEPLPPLAHACELVIDPATSGYLRGERGAPLIRGWARPRGEDPNVLFALMAGDLLPPVVFRVGRIGWSPTVQLTALLRRRPAPGWLRLESVSRTIAGGWFDEDCTVVDSSGRLVCQARQLALVARRG